MPVEAKRYFRYKMHHYELCCKINTNQHIHQSEFISGICVYKAFYVYQYHDMLVEANRYLRYKKHRYKLCCKINTHQDIHQSEFISIMTKKTILNENCQYIAGVMPHITSFTTTHMELVGFYLYAAQIKNAMEKVSYGEEFKHMGM